jgi:hypothetical protein
MHMRVCVLVVAACLSIFRVNYRQYSHMKKEMELALLALGICRKISVSAGFLRMNEWLWSSGAAE